MSVFGFRGRLEKPKKCKTCHVQLGHPLITIPAAFRSFTQLNIQREAIAAKEREQALRDTARETEFEAERVRLGEVALELTRQREHFEKEVGLAREAYQAFHAEKEALQLEKEQLLHEKEVLRLEKQKWEEEGEHPFSTFFHDCEVLMSGTVLSRMTKKPLDDVK